jgi:glycosyltransferase involved in cell wall biosynthesis
MRTRPADRPMAITVVGAGTRFLSGMSYYTIRLANAFAGRHRVSVITMRQLLPTRFYPGRARVGSTLTRLAYEPGVEVYDGVDWFWLPSLLVALFSLVRRRPAVIVFQWWTGTVLHSYLALTVVGRLLGAQVVIEFHEILDTGEDAIPFARQYVNAIAPIFVRLASGYVVHSTSDLPTLQGRYRLGGRPVAVIPHGPYDHHRSLPEQPLVDVVRQAPAEALNLLFFGVIRPFKGLEDLVAAFNSLPPEVIDGYWLTVVGETWEGWTLPIELIEQSRYRDRITVVNRYVHDDEVAAWFAAADAVVLPYHRSSASGPAHTAMSHGLPLVVTEVGGLPAAVAGYDGALLVPAHDPAGLAGAIERLPALRGVEFADPHSWARTIDRYDELFALIGASRGDRGNDGGNDRGNDRG